MPGKHGLVFGASGISGHALCEQALVYPDKSTFSTITGLTNRPLSIEAAHLPKDDRLRLVSGIDLTDPLDEVKKTLKEKVKGIENVTHVFYMAYTQQPDYDTLREVNVPLMKRAVEAIDALSPALEHVILQTGGKAYGVEFSEKIDIKAPLKESQPRIPEPYASKVFYYSQTDALAHIAQGKKWTWSEVRPDVIVGFVPTSNAMNIAGALGAYLSLYKEVHGEGSECPFPGTEGAWTAKHTDTSSYILARMEIHTALSAKTSGGTYNIANGDVTTWQKKWPGITGWFGLKGNNPAAQVQLPEDFYQSHRKEWEAMVKKYGLKKEKEEGFWFLHGCLKGEFDRHYDLTEARKSGFDETVDTVESYTKTFDKMRTAKYIP